MKACIVCGGRKPLEEFYKRSDSADGHRSSCKSCQKEAAIKWQRANPERRAEHIRRDLERHPERARRYSRDQRERWPEKVRARSVINTAVYQGRLEKPTRCSRCGRSERSRTLHAHHVDYSRPQDVEWLCVGCHTALHH